MMIHKTQSCFNTNTDQSTSRELHIYTQYVFHCFMPERNKCDKTPTSF